MTDIPIAVAVCEDNNGVVTLRLYDLPSGTFMGVIDFRDNKNVDLEAAVDVWPNNRQFRNGRHGR